MTWKEYIEGRKWFRGTKAKEDPIKKMPTYWTPQKKEARRYADPRRFDCKDKMQLITAKITPTKLFIGNEPAMVRKLGIEREYDKVIRLAKQGKYDPKVDKFVENAARKAGYDVQIIDKNQLMVFKPKAIRVLKVEKIPMTRCRGLVGYTDRSGTRVSRQYHRGWKRIMLR